MKALDAATFLTSGSDVLAVEDSLPTNKF